MTTVDVSVTWHVVAVGEGEAVGTWWRCYNARNAILGDGWRRTVWILKLERYRSALDSSTHNDVNPSPCQMYVQTCKA